MKFLGLEQYTSCDIVFPRLSSIISVFFLDAEDGIMQYDLGAELNRECLESLLGLMAMLASHLCYQLLVSSQAADGYLVWKCSV